MKGDRLRRIARGAGLALVIWTSLALLFAAQMYAYSAMQGRPILWRDALGYSIADWYVFALLAPPVVWIGRRIGLDWPLRGPNVAVHLCACGAFMLAYLLLRAAVQMVLEHVSDRPSLHFFAVFEWALVKTIPYSLLVYWGIVATQQVVAYQRRVRERELRAAELERRLTAARLQVLQMQLNPHFLFNTLNAISSLMHQDVEAADRMLVRLSELLRWALETRDRQEVPLRDELSFLERYLEIEQTRFGARLKVERDIDPQLGAARVPSLLLQPLVENAIKHGVERKRAQGVIRIEGRREGDQVVITIRDNGPGPGDGSDSMGGHGIGLSNTQRRLEQLYGRRQELRLQPAAGGGTEVIVRIPWRTDGPSNGD